AEEKFKLFAPFYLLDTTDMNVNLREVKTLKESEDPRHFFQYGRPLWGALLMPSSDTKGMESEHIIELAMDKLIGGKYYGVWREELSEALKKGVVEAELTARLLLLNAWNCCIKKKILDENSMNTSKNYFRFVALEEFLKSLLVDNVYEKIKNRHEARKNRKNKSKPENKIPKPQNAWVLFRKDYEANQRMRFPDKALKIKNVSTNAGDVWRNQPSK
ncbi:12114_t:CDS:2, partial [Racocetra fulgida]